MLQVNNMRLKRSIVIREFFTWLNISFRHGNHLVFPVHFLAFRIGSVRMIKKAGIVRAQNILVALPTAVGMGVQHYHDGTKSA